MIKGIERSTLWIKHRLMERLIENVLTLMVKLRS